MERYTGNRIKRVNLVFMPKREPRSSCVSTLLSKDSGTAQVVRVLGGEGKLWGITLAIIFLIHPLAHFTLTILFLTGWQMRMYPSKTKMLGFAMIGSDKVQVEVEEAIPAVEVHQFIDGLERLLDLIKNFFLLVALEAANQSKAMGYVAIKDLREAAEIGVELDWDKA